MKDNKKSSQNLNLLDEMRFNIKNNLKSQVILIMIIVFASMTTYEVIKQLIFPKIGIWESHIVTIFFTTILATITAYFVLNEREKLTKSLINQRNLYKKAEEKYKTIFETTGTATLISEEDTTISLVNTEFEKLSGYEKEEIENKRKWSEFIAEDDKEKMMEYHHLRRTNENLVPNSFETRFVDANGNIKDIITTFALIQGTNERVGSFLDITTRKCMENALEESGNRYRKLLENSFDAVIIHSGGKVISANSTAAELLGTKNPEKLIDKPLFDFVHPDYKKVVAKRIKEMLEDNKSVPPMEQKFLRIDGTPIDVEVLATGFIFKGKKAIQVVFRDISNRKKAEKKLKEAYDLLEIKVQERTSELIEINKELKRSNDELRQFAYITSHDLQEPLRSIASFTQLLERRYKNKLDSDADEFMDYIVSASIRMKQMIQELLDYSRINSAGKKFVKTDMNVKVEKAVSNLQYAINESGVEIKYDHLPTVIADPDQMVRVFQNLISNSIKYKNPQLPPKIHVSVEEDQDKSEWIFSVSDNGIGIEKQYYNKIFEVFKRLHTIDEYEGTGIGLAIIKRIIDRHGGRVWVESEFGAGSTFFFTIPRESVE